MYIYIYIWVTGSCAGSCGAVGDLRGLYAPKLLPNSEGVIQKTGRFQRGVILVLVFGLVLGLDSCSASPT